MIFDDYLDLLEILNNYKTKYVLVGGLAVVINGYFRTTKDMDLFVEPTEENAQKVVQSIDKFGLGYLGITVEDILDDNGFVKLGNSPVRIDIFSSLPALKFNEVYEQSFLYDQERISFRVIHINHLIQNKKAVARTQDKTDVRNLEKILKKRNKK